LKLVLPQANLSTGEAEMAVERLLVRNFESDRTSGCEADATEFSPRKQQALDEGSAKRPLCERCQPLRAAHIPNAPGSAGGWLPRFLVSIEINRKLQ